MMLVRALVIGLALEIVSPKGNPLAQKTKTYDFAAMVPMQVEKAMPQLHQIKTLIIGGAKLSNAIIAQLKEQSSNVYETYGMTETITHIAARPINETYFKALPNVSFTLDDRECLVIHAPKLIKEPITTNDRVTLINKNTFEWLGRIDNVINSGGVKLFPERIEEKLQNKISARFFIASEPNEVLGNQVVLVVETTDNKLDTSIFNELDSYEKPKKIYTIPKFIETATGKIQRNKTLENLNIKSL